jgi:hypothetical protein
LIGSEESGGLNQYYHILNEKTKELRKDIENKKRKFRIIFGIVIIIFSGIFINLLPISSIIEFFILLTKSLKTLFQVVGLGFGLVASVFLLLFPPISKTPKVSNNGKEAIIGFTVDIPSEDVEKNKSKLKWAKFFTKLGFTLFILSFLFQIIALFI